MSSPSLETPVDDRPGDAATLLRAGWPALLLFVISLVAMFWQFTRMVAGDASEGLDLAGLSRAALAEGRWWTPLSHIFVYPGPLGRTLATLVFGVIAGRALYRRDPDWLGGWRMLAVFLACGLAAGAAQILLHPQGVISGAWAGLLGLAVFAARTSRFGQLFSDSASEHETARTASTGERHMGAAINAGAFVVWLANSSQSLERLHGAFPAFTPGPGGVALLCLAFFAAIYLLCVFADHPVVRPFRWLIVTSWLLFFLWLGLPYILPWNLPWPALAASVAMGAVLPWLGKRRSRVG